MTILIQYYSIIQEPFRLNYFCILNTFLLSYSFVNDVSEVGSGLDIGVTNIFWSRSRHGHDEFGHDHVTVTIVCHRDRDRESR
jgi:hypothetical protein